MLLVTLNHLHLIHSTVPEVAPTNIVIQQQSNNSVLIKWDPVPDDPELWNSENKSTRTYKVFYYEYTAANSSAAYFESSKSMHELTNLEAGRGYKFAIAAKSGIGEGVASEYYCIRMSETGKRCHLFFKLLKFINADTMYDSFLSDGHT